MWSRVSLPFLLINFIYNVFLSDAAVYDGTGLPNSMYRNKFKIPKRWTGHSQKYNLFRKKIKTISSNSLRIKVPWHTVQTCTYNYELEFLTCTEPWKRSVMSGIKNYARLLHFDVKTFLKTILRCRKKEWCYDFVIAKHLSFAYRWSFEINKIEVSKIIIKFFSQLIWM